MIHARSDYQARIQDSANKIPDDEPVFLLRAQDATAAATIRYWAKENLRLLKQAKKDGATPEEIRRRKKAIELAVAQAHRMDDWPTHKPADV